MKIKIVSDGTQHGTHVFNSDGQVIEGITDIIIGPMSAGGKPVTATLKFSCVELDIQAECETDIVARSGQGYQPISDGVESDPPGEE
jgi:hypothetical protein